MYEVDVYLLKAIDPQNVALSPDHVFVTTQLLQRTLRASVSIHALLCLPRSSCLPAHVLCCEVLRW